MKILNKFIWSKTAPSNTNDIWFDGEVFRLYRPGYKEEEAWGAFTLPVDTANKITKMLEDAFEVYQEKLVAGKGIKIENNTISTTSIFKLVNELPNSGETDTIYLVPSSKQEDNNNLIEYIWSYYAGWEKLGEFKSDVDLSEYVKKNELPTPDWNATSDQKGYIKNKPFGYSFSTKYATLSSTDVQLNTPILLKTFTDAYRPYYILIHANAKNYKLYYYKDLINGNSVDIPADGPTITASFKEEDGSLYITFDKSYDIRNNWTIGEGRLNKLSSEFIPDTVKNPNWNANEGEAGYIKNRTHYISEEIAVEKQYIGIGSNIEGNNIFRIGSFIRFNLLHFKFFIEDINDNTTTVFEHFVSPSNYTKPPLYVGEYEYECGKIIFNEDDYSITITLDAPPFYKVYLEIDYINDIKKINDLFIPDDIARVNKIPNSIGTGTGSLVQTKEVKTFVNEAPITENPLADISVDAIGDNSTVLNGKSHAGAKRALAHGNRTIALGENSHTEGHCTQTVYMDEVTNGYAAHAEGYGTVAAGTYSHAEGNKTLTLGANSHSEGADSLALGEASHVEGYFAYAGESSSGPKRPTIEDTPSDGGSGSSGITFTTRKGTAAHAEGNYTRAEGNYSHAEGRQCDSTGEGSHAEGTETVANGDYSHTEGNKTKTNVAGLYSHAEGISTTVNAAGAHAEGLETGANAESSHAEGWACSTQGAAKASHAEGQNCHTYEVGSHAEGQNTKAYGAYSHVEGYETQSKEGTRGQHVEGKYNYVTDAIKVIGCGTDDNNRYNAVEVEEDGKVFVKNIGGFNGQSRQNNNIKDLATIIESLTPYYTSFDASDISTWVGKDEAYSIKDEDLASAISRGRPIRVYWDKDIPNDGYITCITAYTDGQETVLKLIFQHECFELNIYEGIYIEVFKASIN